MSYYYFISSLPNIEFGQKPPFSEEEFMQQAALWMPKNDYDHLEEVVIGAKEKHLHLSDVVKKWHDWETALRNCLVSARALKRGIDPGKYLKGTEIPEGYVRSAVQELIKFDDQKKAEKAIDLLRWKFFDELAIAHSFDFHVALTYFLKLKILSRWAEFDEEIGKENLNKNLVTN